MLPRTYNPPLHHSPATVLHTPRLTLTPLEPSMLPELHDLFTNPTVRRYLLDNRVVDVSWVADVVASSRQQFTESGYGLWAVQRAGYQPLIGVCGYAVLGRLQLLYALLPTYQGQGIATEAARAVVDYGFGQAGLTEIVAAADAPNLPSFGVMERLGMTYWKTENGVVYYQQRSGIMSAVNPDNKVHAVC